MSSVPELLKRLPKQRKRTGIIFAPAEFGQVIQSAQACGYQVMDCTDWYQQKIFFTDDQLLDFLLEAGKASDCLVLGLETFIAPRLGASESFIENLSGKLASAEPHHAVVLLLYSAVIFNKIKVHYDYHPLTTYHTLSLLAQDEPNTYD